MFFDVLFIIVSITACIYQAMVIFKQEKYTQWLEREDDSYVAYIILSIMLMWDKL